MNCIVILYMAFCDVMPCSLVDMYFVLISSILKLEEAGACEIYCLFTKVHAVTY
jgi:hypothetical protein